MQSAKTTWKHMRRSPYQALAAVLIMTLTFLTISFFTFVIFGSSHVISYFESQPQVTVFFEEEASQEEINALSDSLRQSGKVSDVKFVSKKEALAIYQEQNKDDPLLLDLVTEDILPASLEIAAVNVEDLEEISQTLQGSNLVSEVVYQQDVVDTLSTWTNALRKIGLALIIVLSSVSIFIMVTIIGFKISQKREEIEIMRLLAATNWYIRWPFVLEGIFYGMMGALAGWALASVTLIYASPFLETFLRGIPILPVSPIFLFALLGGEILLAVILGAFASFLAVFRYLK